MTETQIKHYHRDLMILCLEGANQFPLLKNTTWLIFFVGIVQLLWKISEKKCNFI